MIITATNGIVYNSFTGDVYILNTAGIFLTAGTLTARKIVGSVLAEYFNIESTGIGAVLTTVEGFQINTGVNKDIVLNSGQHALFDLGSDTSADHFDIRNSSSAVLFRLAADGDIDTMPIIRDGFSLIVPDGVDGTESEESGTSAEDIIDTGGKGGDGFDDGASANGGNATKHHIKLQAGGTASSGGGTPGTDGILTIGDGGITNFTQLDRFGNYTQAGTAKTTVNGFHVSIATKTNTDYTLTANDDVVLFSTGGTTRTATLPAASTVTGKIYHIKKIDAGVGLVTIDGNGSETIDGDVTPDITAQYESFMIVSDGSNWHVI